MKPFELRPAEVPIAGDNARFPVHRIYCVGQNYAAHAREMGSDPDRTPPFFFTKPADAVVHSGSTIAWPSRTKDLHHEVELVVAIGRAGADIPVETAAGHIFGYAVGIDLTRRDLQADAKATGRPWDTAKGFDQSAPISAIHPVAVTGHLDRGRIWLAINGRVRQDGDLEQMIWRAPEAVAELSTYFALQPGDLLFTGTPAGVGALAPGDRVTAGIAGLDDLVVEMGSRESYSNPL